MTCTPLQTLQGLIDKQDTFEVIRDQIALILATEFANQKAIAGQCGKDAALYDASVYTERANPIECWVGEDSVLDTERPPVINVWFDSGQADKGKSDPVNRQMYDVTYQVDCYAGGFATDDPGAGHIPGDEKAARESHRIARLARNILMASHNTYLQKRGLVWGRWIDRIQTFQPKFATETALQIVATRITLTVSFNEFSPQYEGEILELLSVDIERRSDGAILAELDIDPSA